MDTGDRLGSYEIRSLLGRGGMGEVYLATDTRLHRPVALKLLPAESAADPERRARFEREARLAAALRHPHICTIFEVGEADGRPFIAMEYVEGTTLQDRVRVDLFSVAESLDLAIQIADALEEARQRKVVHRDLKSANILLTPRGDVKILDFGLAKRVEDVRPPEATTAGVTDAGMVVGTAAYMSPEQALGQPVDHRSDLFSFGVVLYELLTGRLPFSGKTTMELFSAILHSAPAPIPRFNDQVPDPLVRVVGKLLEKDREQRYQSAREVLTDLRKIRAEGASASVPRAIRAPRPAWRVWTAIGAVALLATVGAVFWRAGARPAEAASVVVLPAQVSGPPESQDLSEAIAVGLTNRLYGIQGLDTKVSPTIQDFERVKRDLQQLVRSYGVDRYVWPFVLAQGDDITLTVRVVGRNGRDLVGSHEYTGTRTRYLSLMNEAANGIQQYLRPASAKLTAATDETASSEAELALRQGQAVSNRYNNTHDQPDFDRALSLLKLALERDPKLAEAAAEIALLYVFRIEKEGAAPALLAQLKRWAEKATSLDPRSSKGWVARETAESNDWRTVIDYGVKAAFYGPRVAIAQLSLGQSGIGPTLRGKAARESARLDPLYLYATHDIAYTLYVMGDSRAALPYVDTVLQLEPDLAAALATKAEILANLGDREGARSVLNRLKPLVESGRTPEMTFLLPDYAVRIERGESREAGVALTRILGILADQHTSAVDLKGDMLEIAPSLARHGQIDVLVGLLNKCIDGGEPPPYDWLVLDPRLDVLRHDPRFPAIRDASRTRFAQVLSLLDRAKARGELPKYLEQPLAELRARLTL